ncbi:MAG: SAM-dependent chlorinase/fluorinase [Anaerolineaceae bacterium]|nr:SAM-dependent chlorinase/fluorinase [Anaerolineaceae bacterium]
MPTIALLTDFGVEDVYVGVMKGVMKNICPDSDFIDITHAIPPQDVRSGALALLDAYSYFPKGTVFLVVVDPGVGSDRLPIAVSTGDYHFIAPDNGVLTYMLADADFRAHALTNTAYRLPATSSTFHGRDIFAPAAAHLAAGIDISRFGASVENLIILPQPKLTLGDSELIGEVVRIDHFGNIITSIGHLHWHGANCVYLHPKTSSPSNAISIDADSASVQIAGISLNSIKRAYHEVEIGQLALQIDSTGQLEVMINQGNASQRLGVSVGDEIVLRYKLCPD